MPHLIVLSLAGAGAVLLAWVGWLTWLDMLHWGKDIGSVLFGSRAGEAISLGIGMTVFNYVLIGLALIGAGALLFLRSRVSAEKPQFVMRPRPPKTNTPTYLKPIYQKPTYQKPTYQKPTYPTTTYLPENKKPEYPTDNAQPEYQTDNEKPEYLTDNEKPEYLTDNPKPELKPAVKEETTAAREETNFSGCLHHFGYLSNRPEGSPIPDECMLCQRLGDCMVATVYVNKLGD